MRVALVTGGGRGIGREVARRLRDRGMEVVVVARTESEVLQTSTEFGCTPVIADVSNSATVDQVFRDVIARFKRIDLVINNAGSAINSPISETVRARIAVVPKT